MRLGGQTRLAAQSRNRCSVLRDCTCWPFSSFRFNILIPFLLSICSYKRLARIPQMSATVLLRRSLTARNVARLGQLCQTSACFSTAAVKSSLADGDLRDFRGRFDLTKKNFVVTGGGRGIGYAITRTIAEMGGNVCVMDMLPRPVKDFEKLSAEFGVRTKYLSVDVTDEKGLTQAFEQTVTDFKTLDGW